MLGKGNFKRDGETALIRLSRKRKIAAGKSQIKSVSDVREWILRCWKAKVRIMVTSLASS